MSDSVAPCGSMIVAKRPTVGMSVGASSTRPRSGGAAMSISSTMVSLVLMLSFSVGLSSLLDEVFEIAELVLPHVTVVREPVVDVLERPGIELVQPVASDLDIADQLGLAQDAQVPRDRRTADREIAGDAAHGLAALPQQPEDR